MLGDDPHATVVKQLAIAVQTPSVGGKLLGLPVLLWGAPGVGKTARVNEIAAALGFTVNDADGNPRTLVSGDPAKGTAKYTGGTGGCVTVLASIRTPEDFLGVPVPIYDEVVAREEDRRLGIVREAKTGTAAMFDVKVPNSLKYMPPDWALELNANSDNPDPTGRWNREHAEEIKAGIVSPRPVAPVGTGRKALLFLDEFSTAPPSVQSALLRVVHERVVGDVQLNSNVAVVAAANPPSMSPGGKELAPPTVNRFIHLWWAPPTKQQWGDYITGKAQDYSDMILVADPSGLAKKLGDLGLPIVSESAFAMTWPGWAATGADFVTSVSPEELTDTADGGAMTIYTSGKEKESNAPLFNMPPEDEMKQGTDDFDVYRYAWPSPRSWEIALRSAAACEAARAPLLMDGMVCGSVGSPLCEKFALWVAANAGDRPPPVSELLAETGVTDVNLKSSAGLAQPVIENLITHAVVHPEDMPTAVAWLIRNSGFSRGDNGFDMGVGKTAEAHFDKRVKRASSSAVKQRLKDAWEDFADHMDQWNDTAVAGFPGGGIKPATGY